MDDGAQAPLTGFEGPQGRACTPYFCVCVDETFFQTPSRVLSFLPLHPFVFVAVNAMKLTNFFAIPRTRLEAPALQKTNKPVNIDKGAPARYYCSVKT